MKAPLLLLLCCACGGARAEFEWQKKHIRIAEGGQMEWMPKPFVFAAEEPKRFIDYETGSDQNDGSSRESPWKHHPWDAKAEGQAKSANGIQSYLFKGGVVYRGQLTIKEQGQPGKPIRLTRDPQWGDGPATIAGSQIVTGWSKGSDHPKISSPGEVWKATLDFAPRTLWRIDKDGQAIRIPLARHPNWKSQPEDHKAAWFRWTNEPHPFKPRGGFTANDTTNLKGKDDDFVKGALIYSEFGWVMGTPFPTRVSAFDPADGSVLFESWTGGRDPIVFRGMRYYLEDKPQYLDDPGGEFWFDKKTSTLFLRLPDGMNPDSVRLEAGHYSDLILGDDVKHVEISGLDFRWTTQPWNLDVIAFNFRTMPYEIRPDAQPACIRLWGNVENFRVANCVFEDVVMGIRLRAIGKGSAVRDITVEDNIFRNTDVGAADFSDGSVWGLSHPVGVLDNINLLRNYATDVGFRAPRFDRGCAFNMNHPFRAHIAGNVIERSAAQAINVSPGKAATRGDVPLVRVLIHQNKAWKTMQNANDFGGIESWQHGPVYIFNNLSFDARGQWEARQVFHKKSPGFGHAYYLDGGFKTYVFNNIAWGLSNDPASPLVNCSAFQEIHSFQNTFFNNTAYNFYTGSRRQAPDAGRNKFLGNVWQGMSEFVFRHSEPAESEADANAADAGQQKDRFALETNAYARNVFYDFGAMGVFEPSGRKHKTLQDFRMALVKSQSLVSDVGTEDQGPSLCGPAHGDFRLNKDSAAVDHGAVAFVPWALYGVVAEWNFYPAGNDHSLLIDEHWRANDYMTDRDQFDKAPRFPLTAVHIDLSDYKEGPLENFTKGALQFSPKKKTYATLSHAVMNKPFTTDLPTQPMHGQGSLPQSVTFEGEDLKNPEIHRSNFLIEVYFKAEGDGLILSKKQGAGFSLEIKDGRAVFSLEGQDGASAALASKSLLTDGQWHHLIVEADRVAKTLAISVDGKTEVTGKGLGPVSLANPADLYVAGTPDGNHLDGTLEFLRIAHGTLKDAQTTIEELHAWQFNGPSLRDMRGTKAMGKGRDAGALESH